MSWLPCVETDQEHRVHDVSAVHCDVTHCGEGAIVAGWRGMAALRLLRRGWVFTNRADDGRDLCPRHASQAVS